jgi:hypothetical protein
MLENTLIFQGTKGQLKKLKKTILKKGLDVGEYPKLNLLKKLQLSHRR